MPPPQPASMGNQTFVKAKGDFLASLSAAEKAQFAECSTAQELLDHVQKMDIISKTKRRGMPLFRTIKNFSNRLSPYFKIIETLCSSHPDWSCIAWGAFRLVLQACIALHNDSNKFLTRNQLASNFVTFFEKLCITIEMLAARLPRFEEIQLAMPESKSKVTHRLTDSLLKFYADLFEFFQAVALVFSKKDGSM